MNDNSSSPRTLSPWTVMGETFNLDENFKVVDYLGAGAYGVVCAAHDDITGSYVAIKKCKKVFHSRTLAKRTLRELRILRLIEHENVVKILSILPPSPTSSTFAEIYVIFEIMETDLASIIKSPQPLNNQHIQYFMYQLLLALEYLHSINIVHRDLKPRNLLVNSNCALKVADFGLARVYTPGHDKKIAPMTEYVTTRWYRAPEILVGWPRYTSAVDIWAAGTILAELIGRRPIFPGSDSLKQLDLIVNLLGKPPDSFIQMSRKPSHRHHLRDMHYNRPLQFSELYPSASGSALNLLKKLLELHPVTRMSADQALRHDYLSSLSTEAHEFSDKISISPAEFLFEDHENSIDELRCEILKEIDCYTSPDCDQQKSNLTSAETRSSLTSAPETGSTKGKPDVFSPTRTLTPPDNETKADTSKLSGGLLSTVKCDPKPTRSILNEPYISSFVSANSRPERIQNKAFENIREANEIKPKQNPAYPTSTELNALDSDTDNDQDITTLLDDMICAKGTSERLEHCSIGNSQIKHQSSKSKSERWNNLWAGLLGGKEQSDLDCTSIQHKPINPISFVDTHANIRRPSPQAVLKTGGSSVSAVSSTDNAVQNPDRTEQSGRSTNSEEVCIVQTTKNLVSTDIDIEKGSGVCLSHNIESFPEGLDKVLNRSSNDEEYKTNKGGNQGVLFPRRRGYLIQDRTEKTAFLRGGFSSKDIRNREIMHSSWNEQHRSPGESRKSKLISPEPESASKPEFERSTVNITESATTPLQISSSNKRYTYKPQTTVSNRSQHLSTSVEKTSSNKSTCVPAGKGMCNPL